ncbi:Hypothetical protein CINCED_3A013530 [Cinara cedri]|uniref:Uncharacterized protein n=1 Tax=Cinara cedri TaxID=506608 RepID=A0A5E4M252_9HEMI|nr:Hypothetical protein CINCED_3A013530 [Cinara cedri]
MLSDNFDFDEGSAISVKKKIKVVEKNLERLFKMKPLHRNYKKPKIDPICKDIKPVIEQPLHEPDKLFEEKHLCSNNSTLSVLLHNEDSCENNQLLKESFEGSCNSHDVIKQKHNCINEIDMSYDINNQNSNGNLFVRSEEQVEKQDTHKNNNLQLISDDEFDIEINKLIHGIETEIKINAKERTTEKLTEYYSNDKIDDLLDKPCQDKINNPNNITNKKENYANDMNEIINCMTNSNEKHDAHGNINLESLSDNEFDFELNKLIHEMIK